MHEDDFAQMTLQQLKDERHVSIWLQTKGLEYKYTVKGCRVAALSLVVLRIGRREAHSVGEA